MAKKRPVKKAVKKKKATQTRKPKVDSADGVRVGEEPVPGMRLRCICRGHTDRIGRIAWSPCGRFIASPSEDTTIRIWDADDGKCLAVLQGHTAAVNCVAWSFDGATLASGSDDGTCRLWRLREMSLDGSANSERPQTVKVNDSNSKQDLGRVCALVWHPRNRTLAIGTGSKVVLWEVDEDELDIIINTSAQVDSGAWSPDGQLLAVGTSYGDKSIWLWDYEQQIVLKIQNDSRVLGLCWSPNSSLLVTGHEAFELRIWNPKTRRKTRVIEAASNIRNVSFSADGALLATKTGLSDPSVHIWNSDGWIEIAKIGESPSSSVICGGLAFGPSDLTLGSLGQDDTVVRIWDLNRSQILDRAAIEEFIGYTSAKIVLIGESNVGKSCLAHRLVHDSFPEKEMETTHGMRFWPMEAEELHPAAKPPKGQRRDVVLWDFGGQDEYQLVHQMFLQDTTLALVLIDPTRGRAALDEARDWNKRLEKQLGKDRAVKLLIGAKVDKKRDLIDQNSIDALCEECGFAAFLDLSAKTGRNTKRLRKLISDALDWDEMANTSRPKLFQHIRDDVEARRKKKQMVLTLDAFKRAIKRSAAKLYEEAAVDAVSDQLATQGIIVRTRLTGGDEALVLQLPVIERYAGSLIIAARNSPRGVPVLEERLLGSTKDIPLPGMDKKERLTPAKERMVLECIVELMIHHGLCFRHGGLLVFPTLFPTISRDDEDLPHTVSLYYDFSGAIDNIYASLVSKLMVSGAFGEGRLRAGRVEFERGDSGVCGVRQIKRSGGLAHVDLFFSKETESNRKELFRNFVEEHLRLEGVEIREHCAIKCVCGEEISERIVVKNVERGESDVICPACRRTTEIVRGVDRESTPKSAEQMIALRKTIDERLAEDIEKAKSAVAGQIRVAKEGDPIRILHLSDLHFTKSTVPGTKVQQLLQDLRREDEDFGPIETVEYLIISGDVTDKGGDAGFEKAREFVELLIEELGLSTERCIFVPGNHDVQDIAGAYREEIGADGSPIWVRDRENFPKRFERFSKAFFHPLIQREYPLSYAEQGMSSLFEKTGVQFLALNSAWEIDKNGRKKAGVHPDAVAGAIAKAEDEVRRAIEREDWKKTWGKPLRIGVWHHAVAGPEMVKDVGFLQQLQNAGMRFCLHGDVHETRTDLIRYRQPGIPIEVIGAGSFGSQAEGRPEAEPRLYHLLEIDADPATKTKAPKHRSIRVHTRQLKKESGGWEGYPGWKNPKGKGFLCHFDIEL